MPLRRLSVLITAWLMLAAVVAGTLKAGYNLVVALFG